MRRFDRMIASTVLAVAAVSGRAAAEPRETVWAEDVHLQPAATTEAAFLYEFQGTDFRALQEGSDLLTARLPVGLSDSVEISPQLRFRQRGDDDFNLDHLGGQVRVRLLGDADRPHLIAYGGYFKEQGEERDHRLTGGASGRLDLGRWFTAADVRLSAFAGGTRDDGLELWLGGAAGRALLAERRLVVAIEAFAIRPLAGERYSDPAFGQAAGSQSIYYGPSLSAHIGPVWTGIAAATGFMVSEPASDLLLRWSVSVTR